MHEPTGCSDFSVALIFLQLSVGGCLYRMRRFVRRFRRATVWSSVAPRIDDPVLMPVTLLPSADLSRSGMVGLFLPFFGHIVIV